ncbi:AraC family transcriptional regulator [Vibrio sp. LaRot3]|uniref:AraC family transcriptional regulator n=1 Tax=Vibrio sp. LaRot3 TaxID=2998829 RepID=UPI0022CE3547|nr:AraC family transcriptional regulator [Vibrio sp. LaRot3]MDA0147729.1 AraC family transcriptional regulator [Vibrio sp. LaRot3]
MKLQIENVLNNDDFNWIIKEYQCKQKKDQFACPWHYHSEFELVLYRDPDDVFCGNYFAGDSVDAITHNSMMLYGPGLPHMLNGHVRQDANEGYYTLILWFRLEWIEALISVMPELKAVKTLLTRASYGLLFSKKAAEQTYQLLNDIEDLPTHHRLMKVLQALMVLVDDSDAQKLSATPYGLHDIHQDQESRKRVELARRFIEKNYAQPIKIKDLCAALHISESSAYRLFERHFLESFSEHLKRFRVGKACEQLVNTTQAISLIAEQSGFNNLSNFNRQFKLVKGVTPSVFRDMYVRNHN